MVGRAQRGTMSAMMAVALPVALGAAGLVIDLGRMHAFQREMQSAADAGAVAAAQEWRQENYTSFDTAAFEDAALNGFDVADGAEVEVHVPPTRGTKAGDSTFVEVIVRKEAPLYFMRMFRDDEPIVETRAVAGLLPTDACLYVLDPSASGALYIRGQARVTLHDCGVQVNSTNSTAAKSEGSAQLISTGVGVVGNYSGTGFFPTPMTGVMPAEDPLAYLEAPSEVSCDHVGLREVKQQEGAVTLSPGVYCGGIYVTGNAQVTFAPGEYVIMGGGIKTDSGAKLTGDGVFFYMTGNTTYPWKPVDLHAASTSTLSAPTSGEYKGILFFTDRDVTSTQPNLFQGTPQSQFVGVLYFKNTNVYMSGDNESVSHNMILVTKKIEFAGKTRLDAYSLGRDMLPSGLAVARIVD